VVGLGAVALVVAGCSALVRPGTRQEAAGSSLPPASQQAIPAIDARAPGELETATFALG